MVMWRDMFQAGSRKALAGLVPGIAVVLAMAAGCAGHPGPPGAVGLWVAPRLEWQAATSDHEDSDIHYLGPPFRYDGECVTLEVRGLLAEPKPVRCPARWCGPYLYVKEPGQVWTRLAKFENGRFRPWMDDAWWYANLVGVGDLSDHPLMAARSSVDDASPAPEGADARSPQSLSDAAGAWDVPSVKRLLGRGPSDGEKAQALEIAAMLGYPDVVELLLQSGADPKGYQLCAGQEVLIPLHIAAYYGYDDIVRLLIRHGAPVNALLDGHTALDMAVGLEWPLVAAALRENGGRQVKEFVPTK